MTFEEYVAEWDRLVGEIEKLKKLLKPLTEKEMEMRRAIFSGVQSSMGNNWKEGTNTWKMPDGRKLKVVNEIKREIEVGEIIAARNNYDRLNDRPVAFDSLLRIKYELAKTEWNKIGEEAKKAVSNMIIAKPGTPVVTLD